MSSAHQQVLSHSVADWIGKTVVKIGPIFGADQGLWLNYCVAVEDANPLYWHGVEGINEEAVAPPAMLPAWVIDHDWLPDPGSKPLRTLELHFMLKDAFDLPFGVVTEIELEFHRPVRAGDRLRAEQILVEFSDEYATRKGPGRRWTIDVRYFHEDDELAGVQTLRFLSYRHGVSQ